MKFNNFLLTIILASSLVACSGLQKSTYKPAKDSISIMTYNVQNLFDTKDDPNKKDEQYLPIEAKEKPRIRAKCMNQRKKRYIHYCLTTDWSEKYLKRKMDRLANVILRVKKGLGPDVLIFQEVENIGILERLRKEYLADAGYRKAILIESLDRRGIDVGILSRLKQARHPQLHPVIFKEGNGINKEDIHPTRGILHAQFVLPDGHTMTVLGVHFPSPGTRTPLRVAAIKKLNEIKKLLPKDELVIAGGDFNIAFKEDMKSQLYVKHLGKKWAISHLEGCNKCRGTYYYHRERSWSFLDALLFSKEMLPEGRAPWKLEPASIRVMSESKYQVNRWGSPARFNTSGSAVGVSDHWPLVAEITRRKGTQSEKKDVKK